MAPLFQPFPFGLGRSRQVWDNMIKRWGDLALLRQSGRADRYVSCMQAQFTAEERRGAVSNPTDRKMVLSALAPDTGELLDPEPSEREILVMLVLDDDGAPTLDSGGNPQVDELLKIVAPPQPIGPSHNQLYWTLQVRQTP